MTKLKDPFAAFFFSLFIPGFNFFYAGKIQPFLKRFLPVVAGWALVLSTQILPFDQLNLGLFALIPILFFVHIYFAVEAFFAVRGGPSKGDKPLWRKLNLAKILRLWVLLIVSINIFLAAGLYLKNHVTDIFWVSSTSMEPALHKNGMYVIDKTAYRNSPPKRGDVIAFADKRYRRELLKRIIGLPGESVEILDGKILINQTPLTAPPMRDIHYLNAGEFARPGQSVFVPPNDYFVLGDNTQVSIDSRWLGFISREAISGKIRKIF